MPEEKTVQATETKQTEKEMSFDDAFKQGWDEMVKIDTPAEEAKAEQKAEAKTDAECPECQKQKAAEEAAKQKEEKKPYKVLKVGGKEVPVYSEEELINLAQMGTDYTRKRQADSDDRKAWEKERDEKTDRLNELAERLEQLTGKLGIPTKPASPEVEQQPESKAKIYEEFGIDPEYADASTKMMVERLYDMKNTLKTFESKFQKYDQFAAGLLVKDMSQSLGERMKKTREENPIEEIINENGENVTGLMVASLIKQYDYEAQQKGEKRDLGDLADKAIKTIHVMQSKAKQTAAPVITNEMSEKELAEKYPDLYKRVISKIKDETIADYELKKSTLPPSLEQRKRDVDLSSVEKKQPQSMEELIEAGFNDPAIIASLRGET